LQQAADGDLRFHPRQRHSGTSVNAGAEGEMAIRLAPDIETIRIVELGRIAIGRADADMHVGPRGHSDAAKRRMLRGSPIAELVRAFHPQKLFDGGWDGIGMAAQVAHDVGVPDQKVDRIADEIRRRFMPGVEQKDAIVEQLRLRKLLYFGARRGKRAGVKQRG
jgi:hypothetical protein